MPELPEVEITRENLTDWLRGRRIHRVAVPDPLTRRGQSERAIRNAVEDRVVRDVRRRGKFLRILLDPAGPELLSHLGMTGRWSLRRGDEPDPAAVRAFLTTGQGDRVVFSDRRRFGHFSLLLPADRERLSRMGPEPLSRAFTGKRLAVLLRSSKRPVKPLLMDQRRIAGIGNIQATESLWRARVHPARRADRLGPAEAVRLHRAIRATLRRTLRQARGIEIVYVSEGTRGRASTASRFQVYGQQGRPCPHCRDAAIIRTVIGGRSSFHCPRCQPPEAAE